MGDVAASLENRAVAQCGRSLKHIPKKLETFLDRNMRLKQLSSLDRQIGRVVQLFPTRAFSRGENGLGSNLFKYFPPPIGLGRTHIVQSPQRRRLGKPCCAMSLIGLPEKEPATGLSSASPSVSSAIRITGKGGRRERESRQKTSRKTAPGQPERFDENNILQGITL
ncbi:hypothetical protein [uncultured Rhodoblastus sp.]|uniref:hypothetical protein n=1 Tax=uncultured Rhodoblastus sp. TaxID=543037 RepID=UPI0025E72CAE|nr:hypothetical protein [uncultured Rhodoblastus sp.]